MRMRAGLSEENVFLLASFFMGAWCSFVYDWLRIWRKVFGHNRLGIALEDLGFWLYCGLEVFFFLNRRGNGTFRWFAALGAFIGIFLYERCISRIVVGIGGFFLGGIRKLLVKIGGSILFPMKKIIEGVILLLHFVKKRVTINKNYVNTKELESKELSRGER